MTSFTQEQINAFKEMAKRKGYKVSLSEHVMKLLKIEDEDNIVRIKQHGFIMYAFSLNVYHIDVYQKGAKTLTTFNEALKELESWV